MGLFSKTKTYIESTSVPVFSENTLTSIQQTVLTAAVQDRPLSDDILANSLNGLGRKIKSYYRYGRDSYTYGLPEGTLEVKHASAEAVEIVIRAVIDSKADISFSVFDIADATYFSREFLETNRGWNSETNIVSSPPFSTSNEVTLYSAEWVNDTTIQLNYLHTDVENLESETITVSTVDRASTYYHVGYTLPTEPDTTKYWFYRAADELYETLNVDDQVLESKFFPVVPLVRDNVDLTDDSLEDTELYKTSKKLLNTIGISYSEIGSGIQESPDIDELDHAYINVSAPLQTTNQAVKRYLYEHFLDLYENQVYDEAYYQVGIEASNLAPPSINKVIVTETENDSGEVGNFNTEMGFLYITREVITGSIGKRKTVTSETVLQDPISNRFYKAEQSYMYWRKQITDTQYIQLKVVGLKHINYIYKNKSIDTTLEDSLEADSDDFNVMVNKDILDKFSMLEASDILQGCVRICLNSVKRVKLKWYQTSIFKALVIIVSAVITVLTGGTAGGAYAWAIAITGATAFVVQLAIAITINTLMSVLVLKLADVVGLTNFAVLEILYTAYALYAGRADLLTGENLMFLASGIQRASQFYLQDRYERLANEYDELQAEMEEEQAELDELIEAFPTTFLDPYSFLDLGNISSEFEESPEQYYQSRIHIGNIGTLAYAETSRYVELNTQLDGLRDINSLNIL